MKRRHYIDNIRWMTVVTVVIYHVFFMYNGQSEGVIGPFREVQYQDAIQYLLYPWFMVLLFVISGMCARYYLEEHTTREFLRVRTRKLLVPSTVGLFVFHWILGYYNMAISNAFEIMRTAMTGTAPEGVIKAIQYISMVLSGTGPLWYIQVLWVLSVLLIPIRAVEKDRLYHLCQKANPWLLVLLMIPLYGAAQILNTPVIVVYRFGIYGMSFLIGYFVLSHDCVVEKLSKYWVVWMGVSLCLAVAYVAVYFGENYAIEPVVNSPLSIAYAWCMVLGVIATMKKYGDRTGKVAAWMSKKSWGLYIFHYLTLAATAYYLHVYALNAPAALCYLLVALAAFGGAILLDEIISRIPILRWCVLGR